MQFFLIQGRRSMAVFRSEFQARDAPPHNSLFPVSGPGTPFIGCTALPTYQEFREGVFCGVFTQLCLAVALHDLSFAGPASHLLLNPVKHFPGDDRGVIILHITLQPFPGILFYLSVNTASRECLSQHGISDIPLICQDIVDHLIRPPLDGLSSRNAICFQLLLDLGQAASIQIAAINPKHRLCFVWVDLWLLVLTFSIPQQLFVLKGHISRRSALFFAPSHIFAEGLDLGLSKAAKQGDEKLTGFCKGIDVFFLKDDPDPSSPQHSNRLQTIHRIPGESGEGFGKNGVDPASLAGGNHLIEIVPFLHAGTGKSFVRKDAGQLPIGVFLDFLGVVGFLGLIAVDLFLIVGAHPAVSRYSLFAMM
jgi:hypothetical protein